MFILHGVLSVKVIVPESKMKVIQRTLHGTIDLEGSLRRLFLFTYDMNEIYEMTLHVDDPI